MWVLGPTLQGSVHNSRRFSHGWHTHQTRHCACWSACTTKRSISCHFQFIVGVRRHICVIVLLTKWTIFERKKPISHEKWEQKQVLCLNFCTKYIKSLLKSQSVQWKCWSGGSENTRKCQLWNIEGKEAKLTDQLHGKNTSLMPTLLSKCLIGHVNTMPGQLGWWEKHVHWHS